MFILPFCSLIATPHAPPKNSADFRKVLVAFRDGYPNFAKQAAALAFASEPSKWFAHEYRAPYHLDGWTVFDARTEYARLGFDTADAAKPSGGWRISEANARYTLCDSYPRLLVVPSSVGDDVLRGSALFRSRRRLPVVTWRHPRNGCVLMRSSQPLVGLLGRMNDDDELLLRAAAQANLLGGVKNALESTPGLRVFDCRSEKSAALQRLVGGGSEKLRLEQYSISEYNMLRLCNAKYQREVLAELRVSLENLSTSDKTLRHIRQLALLNKCRWCTQLFRMLSGACDVAMLLEKGTASVLIHCSDGLNRTPQIAGDEFVSYTCISLAHYLNTHFLAQCASPPPAIGIGPNPDVNKTCKFCVSAPI